MPPVPTTVTLKVKSSDDLGIMCTICALTPQIWRTPYLQNLYKTLHRLTSFPVLEFILGRLAISNLQLKLVPKT